MEPKYSKNDFWHRSGREYVIATATDVKETFKRFCTNCQFEKDGNSGAKKSKINRWVCFDCMKGRKNDK